MSPAPSSGSRRHDAHPSAGDGAVSAAHALARLSRHLEHVLAEVGLTLPQYRLLLFLAKKPDAASRLAAGLHVRPPSLTALVDGMVGRGLVERTADPDDGRRVRIVITDDGSAVLRSADSAAGARLADLSALDPTGGASCDDLAAWRPALEASAEARRR